MLDDAIARATIPTADLARSIDFYTNTLGLRKVEATKEYAVYEAGGGAQILVYPRGPSKAEHTAITFEVGDLDALVNDLTRKGVKFEQYDMERIKTDARGIATMGPRRMAWIKDPDNNILGFGNR